MSRKPTTRSRCLLTAVSCLGLVTEMADRIGDAPDEQLALAEQALDNDGSEDEEPKKRIPRDLDSSWSVGVEWRAEAADPA